MTSRTATEVAWKEASASAATLLEGVERGVVPGAQSGVEIGFLDWGGDGELILMHHANGFCAATLAQLAVALRDRFRVISIDARGHGDSTAVSPNPTAGEADPYDWRTMSWDALAAAREIAAQTGKQQIRLAIGHSFGGALLLRAAAEAPALFKSLLLLDPVILPKEYAAAVALPDGTNPLAAATRRRRAIFSSHEDAYDHFRSRGLFARFTPEVLALYVLEGMRASEVGEVALKCAPAVEAAIFNSAAATTRITDLDRIEAEVCFVHAQQGNFSKEYFESVASDVSNARVDSFDVGHLFPLEEPARALALAESLLCDERAARRS